MCVWRVVILFLFRLQISIQAPISPCPDIFRYETDGYRWYGIIEAPDPPPYGSEMTIKVRMAIRAQLPSNDVGKIELAEKRDIVLQRIVQNWPVKYRVTFPLIKPLPTVMTILFAGKLLCSDSPPYGRFITAIDLEHTLHSGASAILNSPRDALVFGGPVPLKQGEYKPEKKFKFDVPTDVDNRNAFDNEDAKIVFQPQLAQLSQPPQLPQPPQTPPQPQSPQIPQTVNLNIKIKNNEICGTVTNINPLIITGNTAAKGDWPWMAAIFMKRPRGLEFICAGTLISEKHILTAAHCVKKRSGTLTKIDDLVIKLGVHNIHDWTEETAVTKSVSELKVHENFDMGVVLNNDVAVLTLSQNVTFTDYIRPVCLWSGDINLDKIVGEYGTVVGWGKDEKGIPTTPEPRVAKVPIVSTTTCLASRIEFFKLTSDGTICAGNRDGSGPCNGDSGGGLFLRQGKKWTIRGIVSKSLKDPETQGCDLHEYVVYTDAAKYDEFIRT